MEGDKRRTSKNIKRITLCNRVIIKNNSNDGIVSHECSTHTVAIRLGYSTDLTKGQVDST